MTPSKHPFNVFLALVVLFTLPVVLAYWFYMAHHTPGEGYTNRGDLITPAFPLHRLALTTPDKAPITLDKKWLMLFFYPKPCDTACQKGLYNMRQIRKATGKNRERVARAILTYNNTPDASLHNSAGEPFEGTQHFIASQSELSSEIKQHVHEPYALTPGTLYLIDPIGNMMMSYKPNTPPEDVLKDLKLLLKVSQIG